MVRGWGFMLAAVSDSCLQGEPRWRFMSHERSYFLAADIVCY